MIKKIGLVFLIFSLSLLIKCSLKKEEQKISIQKIVIENELCENCIGLKSIQIKYIFESDKLLNDRIDLSTNNLFLFTMKRTKYLTLNKNPIKYEYLYDEIDMSKYRSLSQIKEDYKQIIYFKKIKIRNTDLELVCNSNTEILYYLNRAKVSELDSIKMNKGSDVKAIFPRRHKH